jgi:hypothetical protein
VLRHDSAIIPTGDATAASIPGDGTHNAQTGGIVAKKAIPGLAAAGIIAVAAALLTAGCGAARTAPPGTGPTASATPATLAPATVPAATTAAPATAAPASRPATASGPGIAATRTRVEIFDPWTAAGTLSPGISVVRHVAGTGCTMSSAFDQGNPDAWRCAEASGGFYDPCFAPPGRSGVTRLACMGTPWSGATVIRLARPLARSSRGAAAPSAAGHPWAMALANGQHCGLIEGTAPLVDGSILSFGCTGGGATYPRTGTEPWTVSYAATGSGSPAPVAVPTAWA